MKGKKLFKVVLGGMLLSVICMALPAIAVESLTENEMTEIVGGIAEGGGGRAFPGVTSVAEAYALIEGNIKTQEAISGKVARSAEPRNEEAEIVGGAFEGYGGTQMTGVTSVSKMYGKIYQKDLPSDVMLSDVDRIKP